MNHAPSIVGQPSGNKPSADTTAVADDIERVLADSEAAGQTPAVGAMPRVYKA